jgi:hypothetical protein
MQPESTHRPFGVTLLIVVVLIFTSLHLLRAVTALQRWSSLRDLSLPVPVSYFFISGAVWGLFGLVLLLGIIARRRETVKFALILILVYPIYFWIDRLFLAEWAVFEGRWQFALGLTLLSFIAIFWILKHPSTSSYLTKGKPRSTP